MSAQTGEPISEPMWIEVITGAGVLLTRQRIRNDVFSVGRDYKNDLIVDDPCVSTAHLRIQREPDGAWWMHDLGSENGTVDVATGARVDRLLINEGATLRIGHTQLALRSGACAVPPTVRMIVGAAAGTMTSTQTMVAPARITNYAVAAMLLVGATSALSIWLKQTGESKVVNYVLGVFVLPLFALGWALAWALVTRIVSSRGHFFRHLLIVGIALLATAVIGAVVKYADYAFALVSASKWESALVWLIMGALLTAHLRVVTPNRRRFIGAIVGTLIIAAIAMDLVLKEERQRLQPPQVVTSLLPSFLPTKPPVPATTLFETINALKPDLEEERKKDPPQGFGLDVD